MAKVIVDIPDEMWNTLQIGQYQMGYAEYVARYVEKGKLIPSNATNGDVIKTVFSDGHYGTNGNYVCVFDVGGNGVWTFTKEWWNAKYKAGDTD